MAMFGWLKGPKPTPKPGSTDEEMQQALRTHAMSTLSRNDGFAPHYRTDVTSEEDFEARMAELPLIVVWNEHDAPQGLAFSMSVNKHRVEEALLELVERIDPWFVPARNQVVEELRGFSHAAMMRTVETTGAPPSIICQSAIGV